MKSSTFGTWDLDSLAALNSGLANPWLDHVALTLSASWFGLVLVGLVALASHLRGRFVGLWALVTILLAVAATDVLCAQVLKPWIARERPCVADRQVVRVVAEQCGGRYGFPSNHSANVMAVTACFLFLGFPSAAAWMALASLAVGLSRVYLGVHYPSDVFAGFIIGAAVAWVFSRLSLEVKKRALRVRA